MSRTDPVVVRARAEAFRALHRGHEVLVLANVWDAGSAALFAQLPGIRALATTSAGMSAAHGLADGERLGLGQVLSALRLIERTVSLPFSVDLETGYGGSATAVADAVTAVVECGAVGVNLEDGDPSRPDALLPAEQLVERVAAARGAADLLGIPVVVNARTDTYWRRTGPAERRFADTVRRLNSCHEAGADCLFVPAFPEPGLSVDQQRRGIAELVAATDGAPINLLYRPDLPGLDDLRALGVARVTVGSALYRIAMGSALDAMGALLSSGQPDALHAADRLTYSDLAAALDPAQQR